MGTWKYASYDRQNKLVNGEQKLPEAVAFVEPTGDVTGAGDLAAFNEAMLRAQAAGGGRVDFAPGVYWSKRLVGSETRRLVNNVYLRSTNPGQAVWRCVNDPLVNKSNIFEANNVDGWTIDGFYMDGNRQASQVVNIGDTDANDNCIRIVNCRDFTVQNSTLCNARQHGLIGVYTLSGFNFTNLRLFGNGWRGAHIHAEFNRMNRRGRIHDIKCYRNGQGGYHGYSAIVASIPNASTVITLPVGGGAAMQQIFNSVGANGAIIRIPAAATGGSDLITTVVSVNSGANQITIAHATANGSTLTNVPVHVMGDTNTGLFVVFGGEELQMDSINIWEEYGNGCQFTGYSDAAWQRLVAYDPDKLVYGSIFSGSLDKLRLSATDYTALQSAYNALTAPQKALVSVTIDMAGANGGEHVTAITSFDGNNTITITTPAVAEVRRARIDAAWNIGSGGNLRQQSARIKVDGLIINDCGIGINLQQCRDIGFSNTHVDRSMVYGALLQNAQSVTLLANTSIRRSGVNNVAITAPADSGQSANLTDSRDIRLMGSLSESGASCVRVTSSTGTRIRNVTFSTEAVVEGGGKNAHFRQPSNFLGTTCGVGIRLDGSNGTCENVKIFGSEIARNWLGGLRIVATVGNGIIQGARIYDNVDETSTAGQSSGKGAPAIQTVGNCGNLDITWNNFNCRDLVNESYTLGVETGTTLARVAFNRMDTEIRANNGNLNICFGNANTVHYGNWLATTPAMAWSGGGVTTIPAV